MKTTQASLFFTAFVASIAASASDAAAPPKCVKGAHIIDARGHGTPQGSDGTLAEAVLKIKAQIPNSDNSSVVFDATTGPAQYLTEIHNGVENTISQIQTYVKNCGDNSTIVLLGYSQGATVITNTLAGASKALNGNALAPRYFDNIAAVAVFGDPSFVAGQPYDVGNSTKSGNFMRNNPEDLLPYKTKLRDYCSPGDQFCDSAGTPGKHIHTVEVHTWAGNATAFVVPLVKKKLASNA